MRKIPISMVWGGYLRAHLGSDFAISCAIFTNGGLGVLLKTYLGSTLDVTGATTLSGTAGVAGDATFASNVDIVGNVGVTATGSAVTISGTTDSANIGSGARLRAPHTLGFALRWQPALVDRIMVVNRRRSRSAFVDTRVCVAPCD